MNILAVRYKPTTIKKALIVPAVYNTLKDLQKIAYNTAFIWYDKGLYIPKISLKRILPS